MQLSLTSSTPVDVGARRLRGDRPRAAHLDGQRRVAGAGAGRAEVRGARAGGSRQAARAADRHQRSRSGAAELERQPADRPAVRPAPDVQHQGRRAVEQRRAVPSDRRWPTGRAARCGSTRSPTSSTASKTTRNGAWFYTREGGRRAINMGVQRQPGTNIIEVTDAVRAAAAAARGAAAAVGAPAGAPGSLADHPQGVRRHPVDDAHHAGARGRRDLRCSSTTDRRRSSRRWRCPSPSSARSR